MLASLGIQSAIFTKLTDDSTLMGLVTGVFDSLPSGQTFPYVVLGEDTETAANTLASIGREVTVTIHIFSQYAGTKEAKQIAGRIIDLIERRTLSASGITTYSAVLDLCQFFTDPDGVTTHGVLRFRFLAR